MQLEPVYADGSMSGSTNIASERRDPVKMGAITQQLGGVRTIRVDKASGAYKLRLFGRVVPDEARIYKLNAGIDGFIQDVSSVTTGSQVTKEQLLATFCAPNGVMAIQTYILNVGAEERFRNSVASGSQEGQSLPAALANIQQRKQQLANLGMSALQMEEIKRTREVPNHINILSPVNGIVLSRNLSPGQKFERGMEWYRIADLSRVWILADVFPKDAKYIRPNQPASVTLASQGAALSARVSEVLPQFDYNTRTFKVRLEAQNPGLVLRPDMLADVEIDIHTGPAIVVSSDALIDSGLRKTVYVEVSQGVFEPRSVETGWRFGGQVEIVAGLEAGEQVVTSGNFLLDSESRMRLAPAAEAPAQQIKDPACGMDINPRSARYRSARTGHHYYFCSARCKREFDQDPTRYVLTTNRIQHIGEHQQP